MSKNEKLKAICELMRNTADAAENILKSDSFSAIKAFQIEALCRCAIVQTEAIAHQPNFQTFEIGGETFENGGVGSDTVFVNKLVEVHKQELNSSYNTDRHDQIIKEANIMFGKGRR